MISKLSCMGVSVSTILSPHHQGQEHPSQQGRDHRCETTGHGASVQFEHQHEDNYVDDQAEPAAMGQLPPHHGKAEKHDGAVDNGAEIQVGEANVHSVVSDACLDALR